MFCILAVVASSSATTSLSLICITSIVGSNLCSEDSPFLSGGLLYFGASSSSSLVGSILSSGLSTSCGGFSSFSGLLSSTPKYGMKNSPAWPCTELSGRDPLRSSAKDGGSIDHWRAGGVTARSAPSPSSCPQKIASTKVLERRSIKWCLEDGKRQAFASHDNQLRAIPTCHCRPARRANVNPDELRTSRSAPLSKCLQNLARQPRPA
mmetsp:Transcript_12466/g.38011  ORF Transcript_12466/g.38011 Transcript_12466/m.38011 type:complete len:208 (+) Transcript_12466:896-1519(+)